MISRIIELSVKNRLLVLLAVLAVSLWGVYCLYRTPIDAIPDLSENQVIVWADWPGRSPKEVEDQITYPLSVNLQGLAGVKSIRATSELGFSMIVVIFDEHIDFYFARQRVLERLSIAGSFLPPGVAPYLAPDATALGQIFWYTVEGDGKSLDELRAIQDWYVRYQLYVPGVAEVASAGGFVREYQIDVDPGKLRAFDLSLGQVFSAVMSSNSSVGGKVLQKGGAEYLVRGYGWIRGLDDIRDVVVTERNGVPITVEQLGTVQLGPALRRGVLEKNGREAVGGVVMMRYGENPLEVTERIKEKIQQLQAGLAAGVRIVPFYERTGLIRASIDTLKHTLVEEIVIASLVVLLVLWHLRSAFVICVTLPLAVLVAFIFMYYLGIPSNIMSLSGIAISIGVLVDAGIVMTENAYNRLQEHFAGRKVTGDTREIVIDACKVVGGPLFFSIVIMLLSFAPIFVLGGIEGKMFNPLAYTKSFALAGVAFLAITLVPALIPTFVRGKLKSQEEVWLVRSFVNIYKPLLEFFLKHPDVIVVITGLFLLMGLPIFPRKVPWIFFVAGAPFMVGLSTMLVAKHKLACGAILFLAAIVSFKVIQPLGEEFMPPLDELSILDMPITTPNVNITQAGNDIKERDAILRSFPEVRQAVGKVGRAETPTDPAPIDMVETIVSLRPKDEWPKRKVSFSDALAEAEEVRTALERMGLLSSRRTRAAALEGTLSDARSAIQALLENESALEQGEVAAKEALGDALASWNGLVKKGKIRAADAVKPAQALTKVATLLALLHAEHGNEQKLARPAAYRRLLAHFQADFSAPISTVLAEEDHAFANAAAMDSLALFNRTMRELCVLRLREYAPLKARELVRLLRTELVSFLKRKGTLKEDLPDTRWAAIEDGVALKHATVFDEWILLEDVTREVKEMADSLAAEKAVEAGADLFVRPPTLLSDLLRPVLAVAGRKERTLFEEIRDVLETRNDELMAARIKTLNWELQDRAAGTLAWDLIEDAISKARSDKALVREPASDELKSLRAERERALGRGLFLWRKLKSDIVKEMDSDLQFPGWGNISTQPIINRIDMLSTGVRTMIGVKVFGSSLEGLQTVSNEIAAVLKNVRGAVDVFPDQIVGENYLEISIDRKRAARYGVSVEDVQNVIEVALGGKEITLTVEGRRRFPIRVRYPRDWREDEEMVKGILVSSSSGMASGAPKIAAPAAGGGTGEMPERRLQQVPLSMVADIQVVPGPSMIKSENGLLRSYVQLNVRERDIVGFVEEARRAVEAGVKLPPDFYIEWSGQFEHQVRAQKTLTLVFPLVIFIIFLVLYLTYRDLSDTLMMFLAVPGAVAGGAIFQYLLPHLGVDISGNFSVAVWVGYIACFGLATETSIVMLVYLREAIDKRGGMEKIRSEDEIREAVIEGAVHRLRPKLLTEGTTILALIPMLWATGVGAEYMRPMAVPILGGILVADEVIDVFIPVLFYWERCRRLRRRRGVT